MNQENNNGNNMFGLTNDLQNQQNGVNNMNGSPMNQSVNSVNPNPIVNEFNQPMPQQNVVIQPQNNNNKKKNKILLPLIIGIVAVILIGVALVFVFKGGEKTLVCTRTENTSGLKMDAEATVLFKRNRAESVDATITVDLGSYASYKDTFVEQFEKEFESYKQKNIDVNITSDDSKIYINMKANQNNYSAINFFSSSTYSEAKKELEEGGFSCK